MRRRNAFALLVFSILILGIFMCWKMEIVTGNTNKLVNANSQIMGIYLMKDTDFLSEKKATIATENPGIYFEGVLVPYSSNENTLYLSQNANIEEWIGSFSVKEEGAFLCMLEDSYWEHKTEAIKDGHVFNLWLVTGDEYYEMGLTISGMPIISMNTERMEVQEKVDYEVDPDKLYYDSEDLYYGSIRVFDSGVKDDKYVITESNVRYYHKGATTSVFDKKSYSISLQDAMGNSLDVPLLGMRSDNNWKLNSLIMDDNRIREKTAIQIWEQFEQANETVNEEGPHMEYVELVVDNDYKGLYGLVEPVDEKKLELDGNDVLYKVIDWEPPRDEDIQNSIDRKWRIIYPVRIRFPEAILDYETVWYPMRDYLNKIYYGYEGFAEIGDMVYPENAYDMCMFLMTVSASDNHFKNMYYAADVQADGSYRLRQIPWDLDFTFGNVYDYNAEGFARFDGDVEKEYIERAIPNLIQFASDTYDTLLVERWKQYREDFLSTEMIQQLMMDNRDYLLSTGCVERENNRWPEHAMSTDIDYLLEFQAERMNWLDEYFGGTSN